LASDLAKNEPLLTEHTIPQLIMILKKIQHRINEPYKSKFYLYKTMHTHILPLTNICFDKSGNKCLTGSYDRTCRVWNVESGEEDKVLQGHENVVFSVGYNFPKW
jgi:dynein assembly factor with WDR repeat domains 1